MVYTNHSLKDRTAIHFWNSVAEERNENLTIKSRDTRLFVEIMRKHCEPVVKFKVGK